MINDILIEISNFNYDAENKRFSIHYIDLMKYQSNGGELPKTITIKNNKTGKAFHFNKKTSDATATKYHYLIQISEARKNKNLINLHLIVNK